MGRVLSRVWCTEKGFQTKGPAAPGFQVHDGFDKPLRPKAHIKIPTNQAGSEGENPPVINR